MVAKIPVLGNETNTATVMSYGYNPKISKSKSFYGRCFAVVDSVTKAVCAGADYKGYLFNVPGVFLKNLETIQRDGEKPLGASWRLLCPGEFVYGGNRGGKDSMSGSF